MPYASTPPFLCRGRSVSRINIDYLSTYPQGDAFIVPQILTLMAFVCTIMVFPYLNIFSDETVDFMCFLVSSWQTGDTGSGCAPLSLNHPAYWSNGSTWAISLQIGAACGVLACACGFVALSLLLTSNCFVLKARKVRSIAVLQALAGLFSALTLVGAKLNACEAAGFRENSCYIEEIHLGTGANSMIFAFIFYVPATFTTVLLYRQCKEKETRHEKE